jgi:DNA polymerase-1
MEKKLVLGIDFNNMLIGCYYGEKLYNSKKINVNAVKGFFFRLKLLKDTFDPDYIVFANDLSRETTFRRKMYPPYKAQRKPLDPEIAPQLSYASQLVSLLGYQFINNPEYEADDILGMISRLTNENDMYMIIASSDRDMYQLINDNTFIYTPKTRDLVDRAYMYDKYRLTPEQWIEYKMLFGDRSDNVPGVRGIGEVGALRLLQDYGTIENVYNHLGSLKPVIKEALIDGKKDLPLIRDLVTIVTDYTKISLSNKCLHRSEVFENEIYNLLGDLEIASLFNVMRYSLIPDKNRN